MVATRDAALKEFKNVVLAGSEKSLHTDISVWIKKYNISNGKPSDLNELWKPIFQFLAMQKYMYANPLAVMGERYLVRMLRLDKDPMRQDMLESAKEVVTGLLLSEINQNSEKALMRKDQLLLLNAQLLKISFSKAIRDEHASYAKNVALYGHLPGLILLVEQLRFYNNHSSQANAVEFFIHLRFGKEKGKLAALTVLLPDELKALESPNPNPFFDANDNKNDNAIYGIKTVLENELAVRCFNEMYEAFQNKKLSMDVRPSHVFQALVAQKIINVDEPKQTQLLRIFHMVEDILYPHKIPKDKITMIQKTANEFVKAFLKLKEAEQKKEKMPVTVLFADRTHVAHTGLPGEQDKIDFLMHIITKGDELKFSTDKLKVIQVHLENDSKPVVEKTLELLKQKPDVKDYKEIKELLENKLQDLSVTKKI